MNPVFPSILVSAFVVLVLGSVIPIEPSPKLCLFCLNQLEASFKTLHKHNLTKLEATVDEVMGASRKMCAKNMQDQKNVPVCTFIVYQMGKYLIGRDITDLKPATSCKELSFCE